MNRLLGSCWQTCFAIPFATLVLASCAQWPNTVGGGLAEYYPSADYYEPLSSVKLTHSQLVQQLELQQTQLDVMVVQGANHCLPASIMKMSVMSQRIRREIQGQLYKDAAHELVIFQHQLRRFRQRFYSVASQTQCDVLNDSPQKINSRRLVSLYFDTDVAVLSEEQQRQIKWIFDGYQTEVSVVIRAFSDARGSEDENLTLSLARQRAVEAFLEQSISRVATIQREILGEQSLILEQSDEFSEGMNRRVDLYIAVPEAAGGSEQSVHLVKEWESLPRDTHSNLLKRW